MTDTNHGNGQEHETLSRSDGQERAEAFRDGDKADPYPEIPSALLSATHISDYVFRTGAIAPFDATANSGRLKKAAYEGRVGDAAYEYNENGELVRIPNDPLTVKANSIVFVESDIDFRLPEFIALRFNLQIRHVHRGLLLGTGPLVDPGYWGKLCIPLHNLTDEAYRIPRDEGLIWIEFTKTSLKEDEGVVSSGRLALGQQDGFWDIKEFIHKAAKPIGKEGKTVAIRSSIPTVTQEATKSASEATKQAKRAEKYLNRVRNIGTIGVIGVLIALFALAGSFYSGIQNAYNSIAPKVDDIEKNMWELHYIKSRIDALTDENRVLRERLERLESGDTEVQE